MYISHASPQLHDFPRFVHLPELVQNNQISYVKLNQTTKHTHTHTTKQAPDPGAGLDVPSPDYFQSVYEDMPLEVQTKKYSQMVYIYIYLDQFVWGPLT